MERANHFFLGFYTLELLARVVALGLHCEPGGFFSDPFTVFEGSIVVVSWIVLLVPTDTHAVRSMMRCFRSLRMLFVLKEIPGMSELFNTARQCIPSVGNVAGLAFGILLIMGVAGVQFFRGAYHFRCADEGITAYAHSHHLPLRVRGHLQLDDQPAPEGDFSWQQRFDTKGIFCFSQHDRCPKGTVCYEFENNPAGELSFDSTLKATIPVLLTLMIDGWAEQMFNLMDAVGWSAVPYFVIMVTFGGFLVLQLFLAVISDTFVCIEQQRRARGPREDVVASFFDITDPDGDGLNHVLVIGKLALMNLFVAILLDAFRNNVDSKMRDTAAAIVSDYRFEIVITFLIVVSTFCLVLDGPRQEPKFLCSDFPTDSSEYDECANATLKPYLEVANVCLTIIFTLEASLKVFAYRRAFFTSRWNLIDFVIVCSSLLSLFPFFSMFQTLRVMRVLRPLRLLIRNPSMKVVIETLVSTIPAVINVQVFVMGLMGIFTLVGMQLFMGTFASCTTRALTTRALCLASETSASTEASLPLPEVMPENRRVLRGSGQRVGSRENIWLNPDEGNFDSFGDSMLTLFIAMTGDNMPRLMWIGMDAEGVDVAPVRKDWSYAAIYFLAWHVVGTFMSLNLFVGAIVETFSKLRKRGDGMALMTPAQQHWTDLLRDVRLMTPISIFRPPTQDSWLARNIRMPLYRLATSRYLEYAAYFVISANLVQLCGDYFRIEENELHHAMYEAFTTMFRIMYLLEFLIKIMGLGVQGYFSSGSRRVEFLLLVATGLECTQGASDALFPPMLLRFLRLVRVLRILRLLGDRRLRRIRELLQTLLLCLPAVMNVASVLFLVMSIYAVLGMQLFPFVKRGKSLNEYSNFESYGRAMLLLFQVLTGDDWYMIMRDAAIDYDHGCNPDAVPSDCGTALAIPFFVSFVLIGAFIFLNLIVAVVLECYDALRAWKDASELAEQSGKPGFISTDHLIEFQELGSVLPHD
ncbi:voltage-gated ion channel superfamily [Chrysochromulina tobinii]|uniref:Calcium-channel protein CCH1 n=1 Tax=Chrysochromulina tobinii TaxID=1460289 RepID=A0A0M0K8S6_9EUKA|nr:voltage-gated ion channel superfamily [Chrysochromulina tobinii]|eukprot:KOO34803.1 voltage-gated ion channel superfamily [Chrysochromulina sp. CCMP291]